MGRDCSGYVGKRTHVQRKVYESIEKLRENTQN